MFICNIYIYIKVWECTCPFIKTTHCAANKKISKYIYIKNIYIKINKTSDLEPCLAARKSCYETNASTK